MNEMVEQIARKLFRASPMNRGRDPDEIVEFRLYTGTASGSGLIREPAWKAFENVVLGTIEAMHELMPPIPETMRYDLIDRGVSPEQLWRDMTAAALADKGG